MSKHFLKITGLMIFPALVLPGASASASLVATGFAPSNLQGYYQFDNTKTTMTGPATSPDQSGNSRDATDQMDSVTTAATGFSWRLGASNRALTTVAISGGTNAIYDATVSNANALAMSTIGGSFSVSFWANPNTNPQDSANGTMISFFDQQGGTPNNQGWRIGFNTTNHAVYVQSQPTASGNNFLADVSTTFLTPGTWEMVTFTYDYTNQTGAIYINGVATISGSLPRPAAPRNNPDLGQPTRLVFGGVDSPNFGDNFTGQLDEVAIWNTNLSSTQVQNLYLAYLPEPASAVLLMLGAGTLIRRRSR